MPRPDPLAQLVADIGALSKRQRQAVIDSLSPNERRQLGDLLEFPARPDATAPEAQFSAFSPWLRARLEQPREVPAADWAMTPRARQLLRSCADEQVKRPDDKTEAPPRGRSLLQNLGVWIRPRAAAQ